MRIFSKVAESLNFGEAATLLGISNSAVTRAIATLEQHLKVRLINRTTRRVSLTTAGEVYFHGCVKVLEQLDSMDETVAFANTQRGGPLKIAASSAYANTDLTEVMAAYHTQEPGSNFELTVFENVRDVAMTEFDVCFSTERRLRDSSLVCRPLARMRDIIVATPAYLGRHPALRAPLDLAQHDALLASDAPSRYWEFRDAERSHRVVVKPMMNAQSPFLIKRAVLAGLGIARLSRSIVEDELAAGTLKPLLTDYTLDGDERTVWILYSRQPHMAIGVRHFVDFVVARYRQSNPQRSANAPLSVTRAPRLSNNAERVPDSVYNL